MTNETLEQKAEKIDWKEWLPVYGLYQINKNYNENKPSALNCKYGVIRPASVIYHGASTAYLISGLYKLIEPLF